MEHCDFIALRNMLIRTHMTDLKEVTNNVHYENFRCRKLAGVGVAAEGQAGKSGRISNKYVFSLLFSSHVCPLSAERRAFVIRSFFICETREFTRAADSDGLRDERALFSHSKKTRGEHAVKDYAILKLITVKKNRTTKRNS